MKLNNMVSILILIYFALNALYIALAPELQNDSGLTGWDIFWFSVHYGLLMFLGIALAIYVPETIDKYFSFALTFHSLGFGLFYIFNIGTEMKVYLVHCNSHEIGIAYNFFIILLIALVAVIHHAL